jgi:hypothetical protein
MAVQARLPFELDQPGRQRAGGDRQPAAGRGRAGRAAAGGERIVVRGDSALYEHDLLRWLDARGIGYAISADTSRELAAAVRALPDAAWQVEREDPA